MGLVENKLATGRLICVKRCPYLAGMVHQMVPTECIGLGTVGITKNLLYLYDPVWVALRTDAEMGGLTFHEIMHPLAQHFARRGDRPPYLWNVAGDLWINDQAVEHGFTLPKGALFPATFGLPRRLSAEEYYALLVKLGQDQVEHGAENEQAGEGAWKSGKCGSGAGNPIDGEPTTDAEIGEAGGRSESEIGSAIQRTAEAVKQYAQGHGRGSLPCGLDRWAEEVTAPAKVPWQTVLSRTIRRAVTYRAGAVDYTYQKISRRQGGVGYGMGAPVLPAYVKPVPRVAFVLDTSGSMSGDQLERGLAEAIGVLKATGAEITFMSCDYAVHAVGKVHKASDLAKLVKGGGGSSFVPAFEHLLKLRERPQIAIFATDGDISVPPQAPPGMQVIWLLVGATRAPTTAYGSVIEVDEVGPAPSRLPTAVGGRGSRRAQQTNTLDTRNTTTGE